MRRPIPPRFQAIRSKIFLSLWGTDKLIDWMGVFEPGPEAPFEVDQVAYTALGKPWKFPESLACNLAPQDTQ